jgi:hypothetical protein
MGFAQPVERHDAGAGDSDFLAGGAADPDGGDPGRAARLGQRLVFGAGNEIAGLILAVEPGLGGQAVGRRRGRRAGRWPARPGLVLRRGSGALSRHQRQ